MKNRPLPTSPQDAVEVLGVFVCVCVGVRLGGGHTGSFTCVLLGFFFLQRGRAQHHVITGREQANRRVGPRHARGGVRGVSATARRGRGATTRLRWSPLLCQRGALISRRLWKLLC